MTTQNPERVRDVMTSDPVTMPMSASVREAANLMREHGIGDILVTRDRESGAVMGIVTDRDIVVRGVAEGHDPDDMTLGDILSAQKLVTVAEDDPIKRAVDLMMENAVRRLPVMRGEVAVGIVSLGDLAVDRDTDSALARISAAGPNT